MSGARRVSLALIAAAALIGGRAQQARAAEDAGLICQAACYAGVVGCCVGVTELCPECVELLDTCLAACVVSPI